MHWDCLTCDKCGRHFGKNKYGVYGEARSCTDGVNRNVVIMDGKAVCDRCDNQVVAVFAFALVPLQTL